MVRAYILSSLLLLLSLTTACAFSHNTFASIANNIHVATSVNTPIWIIFNGTASGPNDTLNFVARTMPMHGTLSHQLENAILYTPKIGFTGNDMFQYISFDRNLAQSKIATVFITIKKVS